ncbi:hypothetical protein CTZ27_04005 [Streptomyces griseocarneus]|nr:hypothetical protein CTZ27_04005 [Streptomyces griseocarneus]
MVVTALTLSLTALGGGVRQSLAARPGDGGLRAVGSLQFHDRMRELWNDHITYTRLAIVAFAGNLPDFRPTEDRLLRNQTDLGDAFKPFFGNDAGDRLTALLRTHILTAVDILVAAKAGDGDKLTMAEQEWYANANDIADHLHTLNPGQWPDDALRAMMKDHLDLTLKEATDRLQGQYAQDIAEFDEVRGQILEMADALSNGIIRAFPGRFS